MFDLDSKIKAVLENNEVEALAIFLEWVADEGEASRPSLSDNQDR